MIRRFMALVTALCAVLGIGLAVAQPASAATQTCRNVNYVTNVTWARVCLTYTWSASGSTYRVNQLLTWNPGGQGTAVLEGMLRQYDNIPYVTLDDDYVLNDGQTVTMGDVGIQPSASVFQCSQFRGPDGQVDALLINPSGNTLRNGSCFANGVG